MPTADQWESLLSYSDEFTCYSAAVASWLASANEDWGRLVNAGLWLTITEEADGLLGFAYFRPDLRADLGLARSGADDPDEAVDAVLAELTRSGCVIVAGDGYRLPWHVGWGKSHAPHWYVLRIGPGGVEVADPFACRNELGVQRPARHSVESAALPALLLALPGDDPVHRLREVLAFGDRTGVATESRYQWFVAAEVRDWHVPAGARGPAAVALLAQHFRQNGQDPSGYRQVEDIWSIARHRAFLARHTAETAGAADDAALRSWVQQHAEPLAKRWGHVAPLLMQARLTLSAGRSASYSVPDTLDELAEREQAAAAAFPNGCDVSGI